MAFLRTCVSVLLALLLGVVAVPWLADHWTTTIATGRRQRPYRSAATDDRSFLVEAYRWPASGIRVSIWAEPAARVSFRVPECHSVEVAQARWLSEDRGLVLELRWYRPQDSLGRTEEAVIFYDFERASLQTYTPYGAFGGASLPQEAAKKRKDELLQAIRQAEREELERRQPQPPAQRKGG